MQIGERAEPAEGNHHCPALRGAVGTVLRANVEKNRLAGTVSEDRYLRVPRGHASCDPVSRRYERIGHVTGSDSSKGGRAYRRHPMKHRHRHRLGVAASRARMSRYPDENSQHQHNSYDGSADDDPRRLPPDKSDLATP